MQKRSYVFPGIVVLVCLALLAGALHVFAPGSVTAKDVGAGDFREGDIIFQVSVSSQSLAIQVATRSKYSHCGIIVEKDGRPQVFEAIRTVTFTPLADWINRGVGGHYVLMRLKDPALLTPETLAAMRESGRSLAGKPYDIYFKWSDEAIYCSELVWKIYQRGAGIELVPLRPVGDYSLDNEVVMEKIRERFGDKLKLDEKAVAPADIMQSPLLEVVSQG